MNYKYILEQHSDPPAWLTGVLWTITTITIRWKRFCDDILRPNLNLVRPTCGSLTQGVGMVVLGDPGG